VVATEVDAAVANALANVVAHAGAESHAFVLLEDLGDSVVVSIRDDGVGIATGRLDQAVAEGRVGVAKSRILVLSASDERDDVLEAVKAGATGYLVKSASKVELAEAVRATGQGRAVFTPGLAGLVLGEYRRMARTPDAGPATPSLTERETEVLRHVAKGLTARQIAERLSLSHRTVENHVQATFRKLQVANRVELARYAIEHGLDRE
jgi:DNA-binding NarL/FixJ family response regulator